MIKIVDIYCDSCGKSLRYNEVYGVGPKNDFCGKCIAK